MLESQDADSTMRSSTTASNGFRPFQVSFILSDIADHQPLFPLTLSSVFQIPSLKIGYMYDQQSSEDFGGVYGLMLASSMQRK